MGHQPVEEETGAITVYTAANRISSSAAPEHYEKAAHILGARMETLADRFRRWYEYERDCNAKSLGMLASGSLLIATEICGPNARARSRARVSSDF